MLSLLFMYLSKQIIPQIQSCICHFSITQMLYSTNIHLLNTLVQVFSVEVGEQQKTSSTSLSARSLSTQNTVKICQVYCVLYHHHKKLVL